MSSRPSVSWTFQNDLDERRLDMSDVTVVAIDEMEGIHEGLLRRAGPSSA